MTFLAFSASFLTPSASQRHLINVILTHSVGSIASPQSIPHPFHPWVHSLPPSFLSRPRANLVVHEQAQASADRRSQTNTTQLARNRTCRTQRGGYRCRFPANPTEFDFLNPPNDRPSECLRNAYFEQLEQKKIGITSYGHLCHEL